MKSVFCDLNMEGLVELNKHKHCIHFRRNDTIFKENNYPHGIYCMNSGKVKITKAGHDGKDQIVRLAKAGDVLGYRSLLANEPYKASAITLDDSSVCLVPRETFFSLVKQHASLSGKIIQLLNNDLNTAENLLLSMAQKSLRERVAEMLVLLKETYGYEKDGQTIALRLKREDMANLVGTNTESVVRFLSEFNKNQLIYLEGKKIKILQFDKLFLAARLAD